MRNEKRKAETLTRAFYMQERALSTLWTLNLNQSLVKVLKPCTCVAYGAVEAVLLVISPAPLTL
jgi:hypothetical protein